MHFVEVEFFRRRDPGQKCQMRGENITTAMFTFRAGEIAGTEGDSRTKIAE
jgi:hypothetical protein